MGDTIDRAIARRDFLKAGAFAAAAASLAACSPSAVASLASGSVPPSSAGPSTPAAGASGSPATYSGTPINLKLGHGFTDTSPNHLTFMEMAQAISVRTNGQVTLTVFPNSTLGTDQELRAQLPLNAPIVIGYAMASGSSFVPDLALFESPFNFTSHEEAIRVAHSDLFDELAAQLYEKSGIQLFAPNWDNGARHIINKVREVKVPDDLKGLKMRVPQVPIYVDTFTALGATPVPLALPQVYPGLQQGLVDGAEGFVASTIDLHFQEVAKFFTLTGHIWQNAGMAGGKFFQNLPAEVKQIIIEEGINSGEVYTSRLATAVTSGLAKLKDAGVTVTEIDVSVWRAATEPVYEKLAPTLTPGVIERFRQIWDTVPSPSASPS